MLEVPIAPSRRSRRRTMSGSPKSINIVPEFDKLKLKKYDVQQSGIKKVRACIQKFHRTGRRLSMHRVQQESTTLNTYNAFLFIVAGAEEGANHCVSDGNQRHGCARQAGIKYPVHDADKMGGGPQGSVN